MATPRACGPSCSDLSSIAACCPGAHIHTLLDARCALGYTIHTRAQHARSPGRAQGILAKLQRYAKEHGLLHNDGSHLTLDPVLASALRRGSSSGGGVKNEAGSSGGGGDDAGAVVVEEVGGTVALDDVVAAVEKLLVPLPPVVLQHTIKCVCVRSVCLCVWGGGAPKGLPAATRGAAAQTPSTRCVCVSLLCCAAALPHIPGPMF